jgi:hypothetical protein
MARLRINSAEEFAKALKAIPFSARLCGGHSGIDEEMSNPLRQYGLWTKLRELVELAIAESDWGALHSLLLLYDGVDRARKRSEMVEASGLFLERMPMLLPKEPARLREFWRVAPPAFLRDFERWYRR